MSENIKAVATIDSNVFLTFDRLDDEQIVAEMKGAALEVYVYEFDQAGKKVRGLSKKGTDDAARHMAVNYGETLREMDVILETQDNDYAYFKARVIRVGIRPDGSSVELDSAIGQKRQGKKDQNGKANPFWYEQGGQKALRNAKQKLIPETVKQAIIAAYVEQGKVRRVKQEDMNSAPNPVARPEPSKAQRSEPAKPANERDNKPYEKPTDAPSQALWKRWEEIWLEAQQIGIEIDPVRPDITATELKAAGIALKERIHNWHNAIGPTAGEQEQMI